jgi:hypothetical protein
MAATTPSCPRCGAGAAARASRCVSCGYVFFEEPPRRALPRPRPLWLLAAAIVAAAGVGVAIAATRDSPPDPPAPVPAARAERRLARQLGADAGGLPGSVRCPRPVRPGRTTRCEFLYADGDTQLMLVTVTANGELDIEVPYPAQRRPSGRADR